LGRQVIGLEKFLQWAIVDFYYYKFSDDSFELVVVFAEILLQARQQVFVVVPFVYHVFSVLYLVQALIDGA